MYSFAQLGHDAGNLPLADSSSGVEEVHRLIHRPEEAVGVVVVEDEAIAGRSRRVEHLDCVVKTAGVVRNRERAVDRRLHLRKAARLEKRRHEREVGRCEA